MRAIKIKPAKRSRYFIVTEKIQRHIKLFHHSGLAEGELKI